MIIFGLIFTILATYLLVYCIYQMFFFVKANNIDKYIIEQQEAREVVLNNKRLCVIIYATSKDKNLDKLLSVLNNQTYNKKNYDVHVIFQRDENNSTMERDFALGAKIHNIQNSEHLSKDKAINMFLQEIITEEKYDAFVFIGTNRTISERYLENINKSIITSGVYTGSKVSMNSKQEVEKQIKHFVISSYLKYTNRTYNLIRSMLDLPFLIDSENLVLTADAYEKVGYVELDGKESELEYTLQLASLDIKSMFSPYIITGVNVRNYNFDSPSLKAKFILFSHYFKSLILKDITYREFIYFILKPNSLFVLSAFIILFLLAVNSSNVLTTYCVAVLAAFFCINFAISVYAAKLSIKELFWLLFYPILLLLQKTKILFNDLTIKSITESEYEEENINSATFIAIANNGKKDIECKIDLVAEDGMKKAIYREGNRFIASELRLRMYDALDNIIYKLNAKNLTLKICQNCGNFVPSEESLADCLKGRCKLADKEFCTWQGCQYFYKFSNKNDNKIF